MAIVSNPGCCGQFVRIGGRTNAHQGRLFDSAAVLNRQRRADREGGRTNFQKQRLARLPGTGESRHVRIRWFGITGRTSFGELAVREIVVASTASRQLQRAFKEGSIATKLYVLAGLRVCDRVAYDAAHQELQDFTGTVKTFHGCVIEYRKVKDVVAEIEAGQYDHFFDMGTPPQLVSSDFSVVTLSGIEKALWLLKHPGMKSKKKSTVALSHGR